MFDGYTQDNINTASNYGLNHYGHNFKLTHHSFAT